MNYAQAERQKTGLDKLVAKVARKDSGMSFETLMAILDNLDALIMACEPETCEIVYINDRMKEAYGLKGELLGCKCHQSLHNNAQRCDFCPGEEIMQYPGKVVKWHTSHDEPHVYSMTAMLIDWPGGGKVHLEFGVEITDSLRQQEMLMNILNGMEALITVADAETFEILFINDSIKKLFGIDRSCEGEICYKALQNRDEPCVACPYLELRERPGESLTWEHVESVKRRVLQKTARLIDWPGGRKAHLEYAIDVTDNREMQRNIEKLEQEVEKIYVDTVTGIYNRRYFDENMIHLANSLSRANDVLSMMIVDIDHFKKYNDTYGHLQGDMCLEIVAKTLRRSTMRKGDFVARYGGEEFVVVMPNTDEHGAKVVAQKMLRDVENCGIPHIKSSVADCVTVSIGVVTGHINDAEMINTFIENADAMMYESKRGGRNRCNYTII